MEIEHKSNCAVQEDRRDCRNAYHRYVINGLKKVVDQLGEAERLCDKLRIYPEKFGKFRLFGRVEK